MFWLILRRFQIRQNLSQNHKIQALITNTDGEAIGVFLCVQLR